MQMFRLVVLLSDSIGFIMKHEHYSYVAATLFGEKYNIEIQETEQTAENIQKLGERMFVRLPLLQANIFHTYCSIVMKENQSDLAILKKEDL